MDKKDLAESIVKRFNLPKNTSNQIVNVIFENISKSVSRGEEVSIGGFGKFYSVKTKSRKGINPKTKETITIPSKNVPKFKASKVFKDMVA